MDTNQKLQKIQNPLTITRPDQQWSTNDEKAKLFAEHLVKVFTPNNDILNVEIGRGLSHIPRNILVIQPITED